MDCLVFFSSVALLINMVMIIALLSMLQATLTLPGIAGIILTMGMAVDANVLIFERIREELRGGRSIIAAIDTGYEKAMASITDSNLTTLISGIILYAVGSGPIKGFAVTLSIGVLTSMFAAIMLTRLIVLTWLRVTKPKTLPI
jgi:preprotein translocase subunit SecD